MHTRRARSAGVAVVAGVLGVALVAPAGPVGASTHSTYRQHNLVSDVPGRAQVTDPNLVNAWGASYSPTSPLWVSDNGKDVATLYAGGIHGGPQTINSLVVNIPGGAPTGQVFNPTSSFVVHGADGSSAPAAFLFVGESGNLTGWNPNVPPPAPSHDAQVAVPTPGAVDKGLAIGGPADNPMLYAADFSAGTVDVYNGMFQRVITAGNFEDDQLPAHYAPFNVAVSQEQGVRLLRPAERRGRARRPRARPGGRLHPRRQAGAQAGRPPRAQCPVGHDDRSCGLRRVHG